MALWIVKGHHMSVFLYFKTSSLEVPNVVRWMQQIARKHHVGKPNIFVLFIPDQDSEMISIVTTKLLYFYVECHA